jgi:hypothetical protein
LDLLTTHHGKDLNSPFFALERQCPKRLEATPLTESASCSAIDQD